MKKHIFLLTATFALSLSLVACGNKQAKQTSHNDNDAEHIVKTKKQHKANKKQVAKPQKQKETQTEKAKPSESQITAKPAQSQNTQPASTNNTNIINSADEATNFIKQKLGYTNDKDISGGALAENENGKTVYYAQLRSISRVEQGYTGLMGNYIIYPNGTWFEQ